ncbi:MAG: polysaccharide biosynthesis C-terminal domain-containing protein [Flavobacteriales bacterium]|nr:polysaccharide biosynthesis C-terminal domain-containing protein [Flavobacteriales bacterium]
MIKPILGTVGSRVTITLLNLLLVMATGKMLGVTGLGTISLIILGITFILLLSHIVGGGALAYLAPRYAAKRLLGPAYLWATLSALVAYVILTFIPMVPDGLALHVAALAWLFALVSIHTNVLLGRKRIGAQNMLLILQSALLLGTYWFLLHNDGADILDYIHAAYVAHGCTALISGIAMFRAGDPVPDDGRSAWGALFLQGSMVQGANAMQLINYRFTYVLLETLQGLGILGIFSVAVQLAESAWLAPKSLGTVLYAEVSNTSDPVRQRNATLTILKAALVFAAVVVILLLLVPESVYQWFFGAEVVGLRPIIAIMGPGLLAMAASQAFSHYFSGTGQNQHNLIGSGIALCITLLAGYFLVKSYGLWGAAATASVAYCANGIYQGVVFSRHTGASMRLFLPGRADWERLVGLWGKVNGRG